MSLRIGFEVDKWSNRPLDQYTNEELLEYYWMYRRTTVSGIVDTSDCGRKGLSIDLYTIDLQKEIIKRMENK